MSPRRLVLNTLDGVAIVVGLGFNIQVFQLYIELVEDMRKNENINKNHCVNLDIQLYGG